MTSLLLVGVTQLLRGARRGQAWVAAGGAALTLVGLLRKYRGSDRKLIYARTLKDGQGLTVRLERGMTNSDSSGEAR